MTLPGWLEPLLDAERMRAVDSWASGDGGVPSLDLMERAGAGLAAVAAAMAPEGRIAVVAGKGNNGGDGLVAARLLRADGRDVDVLLVPTGPSSPATPGRTSSDCRERSRSRSARRSLPAPRW